MGVFCVHVIWAFPPHDMNLKSGLLLKGFWILEQKYLERKIPFYNGEIATITEKLRQANIVYLRKNSHNFEVTLVIYSQPGGGLNL